MFDVFGEVKKHIPTSGYRKPHVSSGILQVMKLTTMVTVLSCVLVTARQYIGQNINCITGLGGQEHNAVENYCFISGTFTLPSLGKEQSAHPGVGPTPTIFMDSEDAKTTHAYYQWVPIVLVLQAALYYLPVLLWKQMDHGFFETALCKLNVVHINEETAQEHIEASASYMARTISQHSRYARLFLLTELFAVIVAIANIFFTNIFLGGEFFRFGPDAIKYLHTPAYDYNNPLNEVFPKVGKCTWYKYGPSGTIQVHDAMCVLPLNIVNEKTYIFLWLMYILAVAITSVLFVYHIVVFLSTDLRNRLLLQMPMKRATKIKLEHILKKSNLGDWFLIWNFKSNIVYFSDWVKRLEELLNK